MSHVVWAIVSIDGISKVMTLQMSKLVKGIQAVIKLSNQSLSVNSRLMEARFSVRRLANLEMCERIPSIDQTIVVN
jgi:hypothetical protein